MRRGGQLVRQWRLLQFLGRPEGVAVEDASRRLGCGVRTVWRDLGVLQEAGLPIYDERDGRRGVWKIERAFLDRLPIPFSLPEVVALLVSRDVLDGGGAGPFGPAVASAFAKIEALMTPRALELIERMRRSVGTRAIGAKLQLGGEVHLEEIHRALAERRTLRMRYYSLSRDAETDRLVEPYHVTLFNGGLYLVGHCHLRREVRIFAVERIRAIETLRETFTMPADFDALAYPRGAWGIVRGDLITVRAVFARAVAPHIRGRLWHASQELRELPGGRLEMRLTVADTLEVRRWLGRRRVALRRLEAVHPLTGACEVVYTSDESLVRPREASVTLADCATRPVPSGPVRVTFTTQTRLKEGGAFARRPDFQLFFRRLLGRLSALARFHGKGPLDIDFRALIEAAGAVRLTRDETRWTRWARYSARQDRRMEWKGLVGVAVYEGDLAPFWPYLVFGQWTHVGSSTMFGLGRYVIEPDVANDSGREARR